MKITEFFLRTLIAVSGFIKPLMPFAIHLSKVYLEGRYQKVISESSGNADELHHLALLRQKIHPPAENFFVDINPEPNIFMKANICQQYCGDIYYGVGFEADELNLVRQFLRDGEVFFDVGANIGIYTVLASRLVGTNGQVHSFEPLSDVKDLLKVNVELNDCNNVVVNSSAVGERDGTAQLFINAQNALSSLGHTNRGFVLQSQNVKVVSLDSYVHDMNIPKIDFLKIDVEGFEGHVLRGAAKIIGSSPNLIVMSELSYKNFKPLGFSVKDVIDWMRGMGFEVWMIRSDGKGLQYVSPNTDTYPFQNFIFMRQVNEKYNLLKNFQIS